MALAQRADQVKPLAASRMLSKQRILSNAEIVVVKILRELRRFLPHRHRGDIGLKAQGMLTARARRKGRKWRSQEGSSRRLHFLPE
jgi:hypothetical protein